MTREIPYEIVNAHYVQEHIGEMPIVDVRPHEYYAAGHIPTAINISYGNAEKESVDRKEFVGKVLEGAFEAAGISKHDPVIVYCQSGYHAILAGNALAEEDFDQLRIYEDSFGDWAKDPAHEVVKKESESAGGEGE